MRLLALAIIIGLGALVSWIFYYFKRRDLFGGFIGGMVVGVIGALIGAFVIDKLLLDITVRILKFLVYDAGVDIIAGFIGAFGALYIMNKLNHDKTRKKY
jgi:uncharacterized membrane protein YeaQ/YmgE (transglycosylase-associated protein family)